MTKNRFIWKVIYVVCWLIFIGYCIQTGTLLFNYIFSLFNPIAVYNLHLGLNLSQLYNNSKLVYSLLFFVIISVSALKAYVFYLAVKLFRELNLNRPFSFEVAMLVSKLARYPFSIGLISLLAQQIEKKVFATEYNISAANGYWHDGGAYLMMSAIIFVIAMIFQKGVELQNENDLTV